MNRKAIIILIALMFVSVGASAESVTFHAAAAQTGMTWNESADNAASVTMTPAGNATPITMTKSVSCAKTNRVLAVGNDGRIDSVEVTYTMASLASVVNHSYVVTPQDVTYSGGGAPSAEEAAFVRGDNAQFGQFRALERIFDGETIVIGSSFAPKKNDADELLNVGENLRLRSLALTLTSVANGVAHFDISLAVDADPKEKKSQKSATGAMSMTLDGTLSVAVATARPVSLQVEGPVQLNVKTKKGGHAADGSGNASMHVDYAF